MSIPPIYFAWNGHEMLPLDRFARLAERSFTAGTVYRLIVDHERSDASHRQYFAAVNEAFANLPEGWAGRFGSPDHLRKWCLIRRGFRNEFIESFDTHSEAMRVVKFLHKIDDYGVILRRGTTVTYYTAKSQSYKAMTKAEFQKSKAAVLDELALMLETTPEKLNAAGRAA